MKRCLKIYLRGLRGRELEWSDRPRYSRCHAWGVGTLIVGVIGAGVLTIFGAGFLVGRVW